MARTCYEKGRRICGGKSDGDGCGGGRGGKKERKTEAKVNGPCKMWTSCMGLSEDETQNQVVWRQLVTYIDPT